MKKIIFIPVFSLIAASHSLVFSASFEQVQATYDCDNATIIFEPSNGDSQTMMVILEGMDLVEIDGSKKKRCLIDYELQLQSNSRLKSIESSVTGSYRLSADNAARVGVGQRINLRESYVADTQKSTLYGDPVQGEISGVVNILEAEQLGDSATECGARISIQTVVYSEITQGTPITDSPSSLSLDAGKQIPHPIAKVITQPCDT